MYINGASFCCLCSKTNPDGMFGCVECVRVAQPSEKGTPSSFCSPSCYQTHFGACHRPAGMGSSKRPSSGSSSSGSDPGSPPSPFLGPRGSMQQQVLLSPLLHYQQQQQHAAYHHPSPPPAHRRGSNDGRQHYQQQRSRRA